MSSQFEEIRHDRELTGRVAIVTGAASGIGRSTCLVLAALGARVAAWDLDAEAVAETAGRIVDAGGEAISACVDVSDEGAVAEAVEVARSRFGPIDILINNAGVSIGGPIGSDHFASSWERSLAVNLTAHTNTVRACLDDLKRNGDGRIVNIASTEGLGATEGIPAYTASKHGVIGLTKSLAVELGRFGVTANVVCPGPIDTAMTAAIPNEAKVVFAKRRVPLRRYGQPIELAQAIASLVMPASSYINGAVLRVDGGMLVRNA
ncbi:MAG: SDR family oxidoreductase [Actinomycetia bacterium]|nr:SDR family oxidoreductase [Actinomycetes bacterium]